MVVRLLTVLTFIVSNSSVSSSRNLQETIMGFKLLSVKAMQSSVQLLDPDRVLVAHHIFPWHTTHEYPTLKACCRASRKYVYVVAKVASCWVTTLCSDQEWPTRLVLYLAIHRSNHPRVRQPLRHGTASGVAPPFSYGWGQIVERT